MSAGSRPSSPSEASLAPGYVIAFWRDGAAPPRSIDRLKAKMRLHAPCLEPRLSLPGLLIFADDSRPQWEMAIDQGRTLALIGSAFDRKGIAAEACRPVSVEEAARLDDTALLRNIWGSFLVVRRSIGPPYLTFLRDPSGALPLLAMQGEDFGLASSSLPAWLRDAVGVAPVVDVTMLAQALANPLLTSHQSLLRGVRQLPAGCAMDWDGEGVGPVRVLWPELRSLVPPPEPRPSSAARLRAAVTGCTRALASRHRHLTLELSGGLDSAIVLGALASAPDPVDISCVNFVVAHSGGDERSAARAVAEKWGVRLVEVGAQASELRFEELFAGEQPAEPILYGLDPILERASIGVARAFDATAIFTGQGGDALFYNLLGPEVALDYARAIGCRAHVSRVVYDAARRSHRSVWHVQWRMLRDRFGGNASSVEPMPGMQLGPGALGPGGAPTPRHPWLREDRLLPPARRMQFEAIANCQNFNGPTWRAGFAPLIHPLLSLPVVEACLAIPTYRLAKGSGNRALAREIFADWLPEVVRSRHDKGDATSYYRRAVAENLPYLRSLLLDGVLVSHGLLDGDGIDMALREEQLIWSDTSRMIAVYASFEAWARYWGLAGGPGRGA